MYKTYEEIKDRCESLGGYTPEPKSQLENDFIHSLPIETNFYLGMRNSEFIQDNWIWDKDLTTIPWNNWDSPPNDRAKHCCVMLRSLSGPESVRSMKWDNFVCGNDSYREEITVVCQRGKGT